MTLFAQLGGDTGISKAAAGGSGLLPLAHRLITGGLWKTVGQGTRGATGGFKGGVNRVNRLSRAFYNPATNKSTLLSKGLTGYGLAGALSPIVGGPSLPGAGMAWAAPMPGLGAAFAAPGVIQAGRMMSRDNQDNLRNDVYRGVRQAAGDVAHLANMNPAHVLGPGSYLSTLRRAGRDTAPIQRFARGQHQSMTPWQQLGAIFNGDTNSVIANRTEGDIIRSLQGAGLQKGASWGNALRTIGSHFGRFNRHILPYALPAMAGAGIAGAAMADKPYDENLALEQGYAAGASEMSKKLDGLNWFQRLGIRLDPSLLSSRIEKELPGTMEELQQRTAFQQQPGWINRWQNGGPTRFFQYDAAGQRHYL